jgi:hypothetical protein
MSKLVNRVGFNVGIILSTQPYSLLVTHYTQQDCWFIQVDMYYMFIKFKSERNFAR